MDSDFFGLSGTVYAKYAKYAKYAMFYDKIIFQHAILPYFEYFAYLVYFV